MNGTDLDDFRLARNKAEQFRKAKKNFFRRGHEICFKSDAEMLILVKRNDKFHRFFNAEDMLHVSQAEVEANLVTDSTPADMPKVILRHERVAHSPAATLKRRATSPLVTPCKRRETSPLLVSMEGEATYLPDRQSEQDISPFPAASEIHPSMPSQALSLRQASTPPPVVSRQLISSASSRAGLPSPPPRGIRQGPLVALAAAAFTRIKRMNNQAFY